MTKEELKVELENFKEICKRLKFILIDNCEGIELAVSGIGTNDTVYLERTK